MRCVQKRAAKERAEYIEKNRREVDPFAGLTDPADLIIALHTRRKRDPLIAYKPCPYSAEELYTRLSSESTKRLEEAAIAAKRVGDKGFADNIATGLAILTNYPLSELQSAWISMGEHWPAVIFRGASASIRDQIFSFLENADDSQPGTLPVNHALCALAWIGDDAVANAFARWGNTPPRWRDTLHVGPAEYARVAGWELEGTQRRNLYFGTCSTVRSTDAPASAAAAFQQQQQTCPWCARPLVSMLSLGSEATPVPLGTKHFVILTCGQCTFYAEHIFSHVSEDGSATLHPKNQLPSILPDNSIEAVYPWAGVSIELAPRSTLIAPEYGLADHASQIGGIPAWVQDTAYPKCPDCGETMMFLAQLDNSAFRYYEGVYYAFVCVKCRNTATYYQQT